MGVYGERNDEDRHTPAARAEGWARRIEVAYRRVVGIGGNGWVRPSEIRDVTGMSAAEVEKGKLWLRFHRSDVSIGPQGWIRFHYPPRR